MWTRQYRPRRTGRLIVPALTAVVLSYFGYHVYHGAFGIDSKDRLRERAAVCRANSTRCAPKGWRWKAACG